MLLAALFAMQESAIIAQFVENQDFTGRENHHLQRQLEADLIRIEQGVFERPTVFESWRSVYWVKPNTGATSINVYVTVANGISVDFRQDGVKKTATASGGVFGASFGTNNGKAYFSLASPAEVSIFTISGMLYDQRILPTGDTSIQLPAGIYIVNYKSRNSVRR